MVKSKNLDRVCNSWLCAWGRIVLVLLLQLFEPVLTHADNSYIPPEQIKISTPVYEPVLERFSPRLGEYEFDVSWQGISAAWGTLVVKHEGGRYRVTTKAQTYSGIEIFYKLRYRAEGLLSSYNLHPISSIMDQTENSKRKVAKIDFRPDGTIHSVRSKVGKWTKVTNFKPDNFTLDPFSAAFLARSLDWKLGEAKRFDVWNGKTRYEITLTAGKEDEIKYEGSKRKVWIISPVVKNLSSPHKNGKLRDARIFVTQDRERELVRIESEVFIGTVTTRVTGFKPAPHPVPATRLAMRGATAGKSSGFIGPRTAPRRLQ